MLENELINSESAELLNEIDLLTDIWSNEKDEGFWFEMDKCEGEWDLLRKKAKHALKILNKENLTIAFSHENELDKDGQIVVQKTKIELKEKQRHHNNVYKS